MHKICDLLWIIQDLIVIYQFGDIAFPGSCSVELKEIFRASVTHLAERLLREVSSFDSRIFSSSTCASLSLVHALRSSQLTVSASSATNMAANWALYVALFWSFCLCKTEELFCRIISRTVEIR